MKNAILSILLFLFTMICVCFLNNSILNLCNDIKTQAEDIELKITSGELEEAYSKSLKLLNSIQEEKFSNIYIS